MPGEYPPRDRFGQSRPGASGGRGGPAGASRWQAPSPQRPTLRPGASGAQRRAPLPPDRANTSGVYRPYDPSARVAGPRGLPDASAQWNADPFGASGAGTMTSTHMEAVRRKHLGFALFHDGNAGHLWRGEVASLLGEGILGVGVIIWLAYLTASPFAVLGAVLALGLPWLLVGPLGAMFENDPEPGRRLTWVGRIRTVAAIGVVGMHFLTIYPLLYLLLFTIALSGRLRQSLRVAAMRVCLAPGEIELVANDLYVGAAVASVAGPLLGSLLYLLLGDRIILVGLSAMLMFLLASNSDGFLDALPERQRGFLQATPTIVAPDDTTRDDLLRAVNDDGEDDISAEGSLTEEQRERALPEWYQQGPTHAAQAMRDIRGGFGLAGGRNASATALLALLALAFIGGGMTTLEVFYLSDRLNLPPLVLGALVGLEGGGLVLGAWLANSPPFSKMGPRMTLTGLMFTGIALAVLGAAPFAFVAFLAALGMGVANALAVTGARQALRAGRDGTERRAISAAENFSSALVSLLGALLFTVFYAGSARVHIGGKPLFPGLSLGLLFTFAGIGLVVYSFMLRVTPGMREKKPKDNQPARATNARIPGLAGAAAGTVGPATGVTGAVGALWSDDHDDDGSDDDYDDRGYTGEYAADGYDDEQADDDWDDEPPPPRGGSRRPAGRRW